MDDNTIHSTTTQSTPVGQIEPIIQLSKTAQLQFSRKKPITFNLRSRPNPTWYT